MLTTSYYVFNHSYHGIKKHKKKTTLLTTLYEACAVEAVSIIVCHSLRAAASGKVSDEDWSPLTQPVTRAVLSPARDSPGAGASPTTQPVSCEKRTSDDFGTGIQNSDKSVICDTSV